MNNDNVEMLRDELQRAMVRIRELEETATFNSLLLDNMHTGIAVFDYRGTILFGNVHAQKLVESPNIDVILGKNITEFVLPEYYNSIENDLNMVRTLKTGYSNYYCIKDMKGREKWIEIHGTEIIYRNKPAVLAAMRDISIRKKFEEALQESHELFKTIVDNSHDGMVMINKFFQIVYVNNELCSILGRKSSEIIGHDFREFISEKDRQRVGDYYSRRQRGEDLPTHYEMSVIRKDGKERRVELSASAIRNIQGDVLTVAQLLDITEKRMMEEELLNMRKLESVGILAGGIAHDFNNILNAILGNLSLAKINHTHKDEEYVLIDEAEKAVLRAKGLTNQLLTFSKGGAPIKKRLNMAKLIKDAVNFSLTGSNIKSRFFIDENLCVAEVDEGQIHQAIHNLVINAKYAMPGGGFIDVTAKNVAHSSKDRQFFNSDRSIMFSIRDHGCGIQKEHLSKVFDPYFTTKEKGQGLGLASVYSIISGHGGRITAESQVNSGSVFTVYLPSLNDDDELDECYEINKDVITPMDSFVLFMDDEEMVRSIAEKMLRRIGCRVETVSEGKEAVQKYAEYMNSDTPFDAVIMDLTIPGGMGGKETIIKLREIDPSVRAIVSSGYCNDPVMARFQDYGFSDVITKPFKLDDLNAVLKRVFS